MPPSNTASGPHAGQPVLDWGKPLGQAPVAVIMIHGRGAGPENILELAPLLGQPNATYLAPRAAGNTWYPYSFMTEIAKNEPFLSSALSVLRSLVSDIESAGIRRDRIVMLGFSQGACLTTEFAIRNASRFAGVVVLSGGAIGPQGTTWASDSAEGTDTANPFDGTPFFFGCSNVDPHIPEVRVRESADAAARMGAKVTTRIYPGMGHLVNDDEIAHAKAILQTLK